MKKNQILLTGLMCAVAACTSNPNSQYDRAAKKSSMSDADAYLLDLADAAATSEDAETVQVDVSVGSDLDDARLNEMAARMLAVADTDKSGSLSLAEFLESPQKLRMHHEGPLDFTPTEVQKEKMKARFTADFEEFAGEDALLSKDELVALLVQNAPLVASHRGHGRGHGPQQGEDDHRQGGPEERRTPKRAPLAWDQIIAKYDKNGDGLLSKEEFDAFRADRHTKRRAERP